MSKIRDINLYPCDTCKKLCYDKKQCRNCYLQMMAQGKNAECSDCHKKFNGVRRDGTKKLRCDTCHQNFIKTNIKYCIDCDESFFSPSSQSTKIERCKKCYDQYKLDNPFTQCISCKKRFQGFRHSDASKIVDKCYDCYQQFKKDNPLPTKQKKILDKSMVERQLQKCTADHCNNETYYTFCKKCTETAHEYLLSTCEICNQKGSGYFKICFECKQNKKRKRY